MSYQNEVKPITPDEAARDKINSIPVFVIHAVNQLLTERMNASCHINIGQDEIIERAMMIGREHRTAPGNMTKQIFFQNGWLEIEKIYEKAGWSVTYDKPAFNESYSACFIFTREQLVKTR